MKADVVLEGGGVKGIGLAGALQILETKGYEWQRIAGTSAGAVVGALAAAGMPATRMHDLLYTINYPSFLDRTILGRLGPLGEAAALIAGTGLYKGDALHAWIKYQLEELGVKTFGDLRLKTDWAKELPPAERYKLVVTAADIGRGRLLRLPWDYHILGLDPDKQLVADAVRASASIPFFFRPVKADRTKLVDGGLLSNFPVEIFDTHPGPAAWPTFGIKLSGRENANQIENDVNGFLGFPRSVLSTLISASDKTHINEAGVIARTIFIDTGTIKPTDFAITHRQQTRLYDAGTEAAKIFLRHWDFEHYLKTYVQTP